VYRASPAAFDLLFPVFLPYCVSARPGAPFSQLVPPPLFLQDSSPNSVAGLFPRSSFFFSPCCEYHPWFYCHWAGFPCPRGSSTGRVLFFKIGLLIVFSLVPHDGSLFSGASNSLRLSSFLSKFSVPVRRLRAGRWGFFWTTMLMSSLRPVVPQNPPFVSTRFYAMVQKVSSTAFPGMGFEISRL